MNSRVLLCSTFGFLNSTPTSPRLLGKPKLLSWHVPHPAGLGSVRRPGGCPRVAEGPAKVTPRGPPPCRLSSGPSLLLVRSLGRCGPAMGPLWRCFPEPSRIGAPPCQNRVVQVQVRGERPRWAPSLRPLASLLEENAPFVLHAY